HEAAPGRDAGDHDVEKAPDGESEESDDHEHPGRPRVRDGWQRRHDHQVCKNAGPIALASLASSMPRIPHAVRPASGCPCSTETRARPDQAAGVSYFNVIARRNRLSASGYSPRSACATPQLTSAMVCSGL